MLGYAYGVHAPGRQRLPGSASPPCTTCCSATVSRPSGCARRRPRKLDIGITLNVGTAYPATRRRAGPRRGPARRRHGPADLPRPAGARPLPGRRGRGPGRARASSSRSQDGDLEIISAPIDVLGRQLLLQPEVHRRTTRTAAPSTPHGLPVSRDAAAGPAAHRDGLGDRPRRLHRSAGPASAATTPACRWSSPRTAPPSTTSADENGYVDDERPYGVLRLAPGRGRRRRSRKAPTSAATSPGP